jgi:hypothetical protein
MTSNTGQVALDDILNMRERQRPNMDALAMKVEHQATAMLRNYHDDGPPGDGALVQWAIAGLLKEVAKLLLERYRVDDTQQFLQCLEVDWIAQNAKGRAVCALEGGGTIGVSQSSGMA